MEHREWPNAQNFKQSNIGHRCDKAITLIISQKLIGYSYTMKIYRVQLRKALGLLTDGLKGRS